MKRQSKLSRGALTLLLPAVSAAVWAAVLRSAGASEEASWLRGCGQIVLVETEGWENAEGLLFLYERESGGWRELGRMPATVGRAGMGIGIGLHPAGLPGPIKEEGDRRAPAGVFRIEFAFGAQRLDPPRFPYRRTGVDDLWVDDPASACYNRWVVAGDRSIRPDWRSAEVLRRRDGLYDYALSIGHNRGPVVPGRGSAIFLHAWSGPGRPTIGCTAVAKERVRELIEWLDAERRPVLVQGPRELLPSLGLPWEIPRKAADGVSKRSL